MGVRLRHHEKSGIHIAHWLKTRPEVDKVLHPALPDCPGHDNWKKHVQGLVGPVLVHAARRQQQEGGGRDARRHGHLRHGRLMGRLREPADPGASRQYRTAVPWPKDKHMLRVHIGLEDVEDLKTDLAEGFERLNRAHNA